MYDSICDRDGTASGAAGRLVRRSGERRLFATAAAAGRQVLNLAVTREDAQRGVFETYADI